MSQRISRIDGKLAYHGKVLPPGPWHDEPDRVEFEHAGFPCLLIRNSAWCGYVAVPPGHPWHGVAYDDVRVPGEDGLTWPDVHGGLTYGHSCQGDICHVPKPGESDDVYWLGFDCNHSGDLALWDLLEGRGDHDNGIWFTSYKDVDYVRRETVKLAEQARRAATL